VVVDDSHRLVKDLFLAAESGYPVNLRLATEPGHLPFRVIAVALLGTGDSSRQGQIAC